MREFYTVTADDVGKRILKIGNTTHLLVFSIGCILEIDVGKRITVIDNVLRMENDEQRDRRTHAKFHKNR